MAWGEGGERRRQLRAACLPRPGCFTVSATDEGPSRSGEGEGDAGSRWKPTHLVVTVNGIVGSAENWGYAAKHFIRKHREDVVVHCSGCNSAARTFDGVDVMGRRLAEETPILRGSYKLENMAYRLSWIAGKSGKHLFLKDIEDEKPPLLLQMVTDYGDLHFISALRSFRRHVVYSNVCSDSIVGWRTSSIRRQHELPKHQNFINDGRYPHVVYVEKPKAQDVDFSDAMIYQAKTTSEMEVMLKGLNRIPWERVDVSFKKSRQRIFAHSTIQGRRICTGHRRVPPILATSLVLCIALHYLLKEPAPKVQTAEKGAAAMSAALIGSRPPRCEGRCALCGRCEAVQVPVAPRDKGAGAGHFRLFGAFGDRVDESSTNYKPLNWKCRCADRRILNP